MSYQINTDIERLTDGKEYINDSITVLTKDSIHVDDYNSRIITSLDSIIYGFTVDTSLSFWKIIPNIISKEIMNNTLSLKNCLLVEQIKEIISKSPISTFEFNVWRGLPITLDVKVGETMIHKPFMFTSLHKSTAINFLNDTQNCYIEEKFDVSKTIQITDPNVRSLMKIRIPEGTHYHEYPLNNWPLEQSYVYSQILFTTNHKLYVNAITKMKDYTLYDMTLLK